MREGRKEGRMDGWMDGWMDILMDDKYGSNFFLLKGFRPHMNQ
jgi:hypothetical protein